MQPGDMVRIKIDPILRGYEGEVGVIIANAKRLHIPAAKVFVKGEVLEFDLDELEFIK